MKNNYVGMEAVTVTKICMVGRVKINGKILDAHSKFFPIGSGKTVRVVGSYLGMLIIEPKE